MGLSRGERTILVLDVSHAHFHPKSRRELYIWLPAEDRQSGHDGKLQRTVYGTRDACDECYGNAAMDQGYDIRLSSPCLYFHREEDSHGWRQGDNLMFEGEDTCNRRMTGC